MALSKQKISIVIPAFNEEKLIFQNVLKISNIAKSLTKYDYEIIIINDGSRDNTWSEILKLGQKDSNIKGINLSRNFGKEIAITSGLHTSSGDAIITLDADGQHPIDKIPEFINKWEEGFKVVYNVRPKIKGANLVKRLGSKVFYTFFNKISSFQLEPGTTDYRLLDKEVVEIYNQFGEKNRIYRGLVDWINYEKTTLVFDALPNPEGRTPSYSIFKLIKLALDSITTFSLFPLKLVGYLGLIITFTSGFGLALMIADKLMYNIFASSTMAFVVMGNTLLIGIVLMSLGMIALYIANIHDEVINRPLYIIKDKVNLK